MFLKTGELKKMMKAALKGSGLCVGTIDGYYQVCAGRWGLHTETAHASNKFKAALTELIGDLPEPGESCRYTILEGKLHKEREAPVEAYELWKLARDRAVCVPMFLSAWPHEYLVLQTAGDLRFRLADRVYTTGVISGKELDKDVESMPGRPSYHAGCFYWKNATTIYWVHEEKASQKVKDTLFGHLSGMDFFKADWLEKEARESVEEGEEAESEDVAELPY